MEQHCRLSRGEISAYDEESQTRAKTKETTARLSQHTAHSQRTGADGSCPRGSASASVGDCVDAAKAACTTLPPGQDCSRESVAGTDRSNSKQWRKARRGHGALFGG